VIFYRLNKMINRGGLKNEIVIKAQGAAERVTALRLAGSLIIIYDMLHGAAFRILQLNEDNENGKSKGRKKRQQKEAG